MFLTCRYGGDLGEGKREQVILIQRNMAKRETSKGEEMAEVKNCIVTALRLWKE